MGWTAASREVLRVGHVDVDVVTLEGAIEAIDALVSAGRGGAVHTPNVDHVVIAERNAEFRSAYARASLCVADGMPIVWASRLLGRPLPERVAGSDLMEPLAERAAARGWRVYLLGAGPGVAESAARRLREDFGVDVVGTDSPHIRLDGSPDDSAAALARIGAARPDLVLVALGAPKQEIWIHRNAPALGGAVAMGVGACLDFLAGRVARAPRWMARGGLEWLYRLVREPGRMWRRYLVDDPRFVSVVARTLRERRRQPSP